jgi:hypothetical protein
MSFIGRWYLRMSAKSWLQGPDGDRHQIKDRFRKFGQDAIDILLSVLRDSNNTDTVRANAAFVLGELQLPTSIPGIVEILDVMAATPKKKRLENKFWWQVVEATKKFGPAAADAARPLAQLMTGEGWNNIIPTAFSIGEPMIPELTRLLSENTVRRLYSAWILDHMDYSDPNLAGMLIPIWKDRLAIKTAQLLRLTVRAAPDSCEQCLREALKAVRARHSSAEDTWRSVDFDLTAQAGRQLALMEATNPALVAKFANLITSVLDLFIDDLRKEANDDAGVFYPSPTPHIAHFGQLARSRLPEMQDLASKARNPCTHIRIRAATACIEELFQPTILSMLDTIIQQDSRPTGSGLLGPLAYIASHSPQSTWGQNVQALASCVGPREIAFLHKLAADAYTAKAAQDVLETIDRERFFPPLYFNLFPQS